MQEDFFSRFKEFMKTDRAVLMLCMGVAFVFWLATKLSYSYTSSFVVPLHYEIPPNKVFTRPPAQQLEVDIEGSGWELLSLLFGQKDDAIEIKVTAGEVRNITTSSLKNKVLDYAKNVNILHIMPENIQLKTENSASKSIPVVLDYQIDLAPLHQYADSIRLQPSQVKITGPASVVRDINQWKTTPLIAQNIKKSIDQKIPLKIHSNRNVHFEPDSVRCMAEVEEITEKKIKVPIQVLNAPDSLLFVILPKQIEVSCSVGLSDYDDLDAADFSAIIDYQKVNLRNADKVRIRLMKKPSFVKYLNYHPQKVDFIIRKN